MKRRILFVVTYFDCGGINRALQNLLNYIDVDRYDVDVFGMVPDGMFSTLYNNCCVLPRYYLLSVLMARYHQQRGLSRIISLLVKGMNKASMGIIGERIKRDAAKHLKKRGYDTVVAFSEGAPTSFVRLMNHNNSVAWIHCDYSSYQKMINQKDERAIYYCFRHIVCVAEYPRRSFISCYPELSSRTTTIYNILDDGMMKSLSQKEVKETFSKELFNIVSVGRLDPVKRLSIIPILAKHLIKTGCRFKWYIIGPKGGNEDEYRQLIDNISSFGVSGEVHYLGEKDNPYAYIARADLLVNTSISEACPYVINEALILHTPVVCTSFGSASEFIKNKENGFICPIEMMSDTIIDYISDKELQCRIKTNLSKFKYDNEVLLNQVYQVIG